MRKRNAPRPDPSLLKIATKSTPIEPNLTWKLMLWALFWVNSLLFLKGCLDETHIPRFTFVAATVLASLILLKKELKTRSNDRLDAFDLLFLIWLGINWASVGWAFNWAEAVLAAQKVFLAWMVFWLFKKSMLQNENFVRKTLAIATPILTIVVCGVLFVQLINGIEKVGLNNDDLYNFMKGLYGNKGLAADFLFILLIFNVLLKKLFRWQWLFWFNIAMLTALILLLQTRTVYLAVGVALTFYIISWSLVSREFRVTFLKRILPTTMFVGLVLASLLAWKGRGTSLVERLNPTTYLESASANERRFVWYKTDLLIQERPWLGVGNGNWKIFFPSKNIQGAYRLQEKNIVFTRAHNDYLEIRAEMGILGASIFVLIFLMAGMAVLWGLRFLEKNSEKHELAVLGAGLLGYCVIQFFDFPRERMEQQVMLAIMLAWVIFLTQKMWEHLPQVKASGNFQLGWWAAVMGSTFCLVIGWYRIIGERNTLQALTAQIHNDNDALIRAANAAESAFYQLSDVVLPMSWYAGVGYFQKNEIPTAVEKFAKAYQQNPYSFQVLNNYAAALTKANQYEEAIPIFEKALEINPRYTDGRFNLSFAYIQLGNYLKAKENVLAIDTIVGAKTPDELQKNKAVAERKATFLRQIENLISTKQ